MHARVCVCVLVCVRTYACTQVCVCVRRYLYTRISMSVLFAGVWRSGGVVCFRLPRVYMCWSLRLCARACIVVLQAIQTCVCFIVFLCARVCRRLHVLVAVRACLSDR